MGLQFAGLVNALVARVRRDLVRAYHAFQPLMRSWDRLEPAK